MLNAANPTQENIEEVIIHELMHIKMYPLNQVTESLITNCFKEGTVASKFAYQQFFTALEQTVEELAKCSCMNLVKTKSFPMADAVNKRHRIGICGGVQNEQDQGIL